MEDGTIVLLDGVTKMGMHNLSWIQNTNPGIEEIHLLAKGHHTQNETLDNKGRIHAGDHHLNRISGFPEVHEVVEGEVFELMTNKIPGNKIISNCSQENTTSILGKLFGSGPTIKDGGTTGFLEKIKPDDSLSPHNVQSSRFVQWFNEDEKKPVGDFSSNRPNDLLSLIDNGKKAYCIAPELSYKGFRNAKTPSDLKHVFNSFRQESVLPPVAAVPTCEDLEQTIMSEYSEKSSNLLPPVPDWSVSGQVNVDARVVDNQATHHLLLLLQKGTAIDDGPNTNIGPVEAHSTSENPKDGDDQEVANSGQNLSLEALFGTAFMKELQSAQASVSAQRAPPGSARIDIFEPHDLSVSNVGGMGPTMKNYETKPLPSKQKQPAKSDDTETLLHFDGQGVEVDPSVFSKQTIGTGEIQLPEVENLIIAGDAANTHSLNIGKMLPGDVVFDISEKLAVLNSAFRGRGRKDNLTIIRTRDQCFIHKILTHNTPASHKFPGNTCVPPLHHFDARVTNFDRDYVIMNYQYQIIICNKTGCRR